MFDSSEVQDVSTPCSNQKVRDEVAKTITEKKNSFIYTHLRKLRVIKSLKWQTHKLE